MRPFAKALPVLLAAAVIASATPTFAGPAENAFLQKLTANWVCKGKISGQNGGPIACRIVVTAGSQSARYQGRCNIPDMATQAFSGAIVYNDAKKQYEYRTVGGTVPGITRGNSLVSFFRLDLAVALGRVGLERFQQLPNYLLDIFHRLVERLLVRLRGMRVT